MTSEVADGVGDVVDIVEQDDVRVVEEQVSAPVIREKNNDLSLLNAMPASKSKDFSTYYRSKVFSTTVGPNPLSSAAAPLLALIPRFDLLPESVSAEAVYQQLAHELNAFESTCLSRDYDPHTIMLAKRALSEVIDEVIFQTDWGITQQWDIRVLRAMDASSDEVTSYSDQFFAILEFALQQPKVYLHLLELLYQCMSLGYQGKYFHQPDGEEQLVFLSRRTYQVIRQCREELPQVQKREQAVDAASEHTTSYWLMGMMALLLVSLFIGLNFIQNFRGEQLSKELSIASSKTH